MNIGYCISCNFGDCPTPRVKQQPGGNCSFWTDGKPQPTGQAVNHDPKSDCFKGIPDGSTLTRRINQCPKCSGNMPGLTCSDCGYEFELESKP